MYDLVGNDPAALESEDELSDLSTASMLIFSDHD
jgi:hypothetical protein